MLRFTITAGAAALAIAAGTAAAAAPAMAAGAAPVQAVTMAAPQFVTHVNGHADTTSLINPVPTSQQAVTNTPYGPVWAYDTETVKLTPVQVTPSVANGQANWQVTVDVTGSFAGFADPNTGAALTSGLSMNVRRVGQAALVLGWPQRCWRWLRMRARSRRWAARTSGWRPLALRQRR